MWITIPSPGGKVLVTGERVRCVISSLFMTLLLTQTHTQNEVFVQVTFDGRPPTKVTITNCDDTYTGKRMHYSKRGGRRR